MFNSLANMDKEFHWSIAYNWYLVLHVEDVALKYLKTIRLVKY